MAAIVVWRSIAGPLLLGALLIAAAVPAGAAPQDGSRRAAPLYVATSGSDDGVCTRSSPCASFDRAYGLARSGTTVYVSGGAYAAQTIRERVRRARPRVTFRPLGRQKVVVAQLTVQGSRLEFRNMALKDLELPRQADDVVFRTVRNRGVFMQGASNISFIGGEITCGMCAYHSHIENGGADSAPPRHILFDRVYFHDWHSVAGEHVECLQILGGDAVTIRNSVFKNCGTANNGRGATADLHIAWIGNGPKTKNILLENNFFYPSGNAYAIQMDDYANIDLRYNSIAGPILVFDRAGPGTGLDFVGNVMVFSGCRGEADKVPIRWRYNVMDGGVCGPTDWNGPSGFRNRLSNLRLRPRAAAINRGDPRSFPRFDIDGQRRPKGSRPDAGADEAR